jgi:hypothetical protein
METLVHISGIERRRATGQNLKKIFSGAENKVLETDQAAGY